MWKYKYSSYVKGNLNFWYPASEKKKASSDNLSFLDGGQKYFDEFLKDHPVDERRYFGGRSPLGDFFSGYSDALGTLKMFLGIPSSGYNGVEVYARYFTYDKNGDLIYGKWCHYSSSLVKSGSSGSEWDDDDTLHSGFQSNDGLTDDEKDYNENLDDPRKDPDLNVSSPDGDYGKYAPNFDAVTNILNGLRNFGTGFLDMFFSVFGFLPAWLQSLIYLSFAVSCIVALWKLIRG